MSETLIKEYKLKLTHFEQLDGLRCIAVMAVLICHWVTITAVEVIPLGSMGVNLFFVLSGFLISRILFVNKDSNDLNNISHFGSLKQFYIRRSIRIFPIYFITIFVLFLINFEAVRENIGWLVTYTLNIKFSQPNVWESNQLGYLVHLWSLCVEEQFYIFFPFLIFFIPKSKLKITIYGLIILGILSRFLLWQFDAPKNSIYALLPSCADAFGIGALLSYYFLYEIENLKKIISNNILFISVVVIFIVSIIYSHYFIYKYGECRTVLERFLFCVCCFWIVGKAALGNYSGWIKKFLENKRVVYLGKISYGLYIYHNFIHPLLIQSVNKLYSNLTFKRYFEKIYYNTHLTFFKNFVNNNGSILMVILLFSLTILVASISWRYIEKPINQLKEKFNY